jgi:cell division FtsZ-interacting protein ZapD
MKQQKEQKKQQGSTVWNPSVSSMNAITLTVLRLIKESANYDGKWQTKSKKGKRN